MGSHLVIKDCHLSAVMRSLCSVPPRPVIVRLLQIVTGLLAIVKTGTAEPYRGLRKSPTLQNELERLRGLRVANGKGNHYHTITITISNCSIRFVLYTYTSSFTENPCIGRSYQRELAASVPRLPKCSHSTVSVPGISWQCYEITKPNINSGLSPLPALFT